jgi:hypothetical protein
VPSKKQPSNVTPIRSPARRLMDLYPSSAKYHGFWTPGHETEDERGKVKVAWVKSDGTVEPGYCDVKFPITEAHWQQHLDGKRALVPCLSCDDGTAKAICLDVDIYGIDLSILTNRASHKAADFPLYVRPSKSAAHVVAFLDTPIPIEEAQLAARGIAKKLDLVKFAKEHAPTVEHPFEFFPKAPKKGRPACLNMPYVGGSEYATGFVRPDKSDEEIPLEECRIGRGVAYCEGVSPRGRDYYDSILALAGDKFAPHVMASLSHIELKSKLHNQLCRKHAKAALEIVKKNVINARLLECLDYLISNIETGPGYVDNPEFRKLSAGYIRWSA